MKRFRKNWKRKTAFLLAAVVTVQSGAVAAGQEVQSEEIMVPHEVLSGSVEGQSEITGAIQSEGTDERNGRIAEVQTGIFGGEEAKEELYKILRRQEEMAGASLLEQTVGFEEIFEAAQKRGLGLNMEFGLSEGTAETLGIPAEEIDGGSVRLNTQVDTKLQKWLFEAEAASKEDSVLGLSLYGDQERLALSLPQFFEGAVAIGSGSLVKQYTGSVLEQVLGEYPEELPDINLDFFPEMKDVTGSYDLLGEWEKTVEEETEKFGDSLVVEKKEEEGQQIYQVTCETEKAIEVYRDLMSEYCSLLMKTGIFSIDDIWEMEDTMEEGFDMARLMLDDEITVAYYVQDGLVTQVQFMLHMDGNKASVTVEEDDLANDALGEDSAGNISASDGTVADMGAGEEKLADITVGEDAAADTEEESITDITVGGDSAADTGEDIVTDIAIGGDAAADIETEADNFADIEAGETETIYDPDQDVTLDFEFVYQNPANPEAGFDLTMKGIDGNGTEQIGMLVKMVTETEEKSSDTTVSIRLEELGEVVYESELLHYGYDAATGDFDINMTISDEETEVSFVLDSTFTDVEKGNHFTWVIDQLSLYSGEERMGVKGFVTLAADPGEISQPGNIRMLFELTEEQFIGLMTEIQGKAMSWAQQFEEQPETEEVLPSGEYQEQWNENEPETTGV